MLARVSSSAVLGVDAYLVDVEVDIAGGLPAFNIVGLPDAAVQESRERVRSAIRNSGFDFPQRRITINLAPADVRKEGPSFDLPIAVGILAATGQLEMDLLEGCLFVGELSLDGTLRSAAGVLPIAMKARGDSVGRMIVPSANAREAAIVQGPPVYGVASLSEVFDLLQGGCAAEPVFATIQEAQLEQPSYSVDFSDVKSQHIAKRALEVAAAGGHNLLMVGPPGSGKTMLARRLPTILPPLELDEALQTTQVYSVAGILRADEALVTRRPFRSPHHTISNAGLSGGGAHPRPGEVSLAHNGVLFLDEFPEFRRDVLEVLRQPLEDGVVTISRASGSLTYPARFMLVAAMNPCPCGFFNDTHVTCTCTPKQIRQYLQRISGPLLDRLDIHVEVPRLKQDELMQKAEGECSASIRERVWKAREIQRKRFDGTGIFCNAQMGSRQIREYCRFSETVRTLLRGAISQLNLSARAYDRILKVSRTIADLAGEEEISAAHVAEAIQYRSLDRKYWN
ncbi:MAG: YifB family Mg chelatase-like AAA ATPase [Armatimonadota bacterium]